MRLLFVHGIGPTTISEVAWREKWVRALTSGDDGLPEGLLAGRVECVHYSQWGWRPDTGAQGTFVGDSSEFMEELAGEWLHAASRSSDVSLAAPAREALGIGEVGEEPMGPMRAVSGAVSMLAKVPLFADAGFAALTQRQKWNLWQVDAYVNDLYGSKEAIWSLFEAALESADEPVVILAHSLGSVVAYEAIHRFKPEVALLVTFGSPLGLDRLIYPRLMPPASYPDTVKQWLNVADYDDPVAADPKLADRFPDPDRRLTDIRVHNQGRFAWHNADAYLTQKPIRDALKALLT